MLEVAQTLYRHRELIGILVAKQLKLRYRGTVLGFVWTLLNPLLLMLVYSLVFSVYFRLDMEHYPAFLFTGLLPWLWFASSLQQGVTSICMARPRHGVAFPGRLPVVTVLANTVNFLLTLPLLLAFLLASRVRLGPPLLLLPVLIGLEFLLGLGLVLIAAAVNVRFRDLQHIILHLLTVLQFLTPIFYPMSLIPDAFRPWVYLNPLAILIDAFHEALSKQMPNAPALSPVVLTCVVLVAATACSRYKQTFRRAFFVTMYAVLL